MTSDSEADGIVLTGHEIVFILGLGHGPSSDNSRSALELVAGDAASDPALYGMTTLLARGFGHLEDGDLVLDGPVRHIATALLRAETWMRVAVVADEGVTVYVVAQSPTAAIALQAQALGTYAITPIKVDTDLRELSVDVVREVSDGMVPASFTCSAQAWTAQSAAWAVTLLEAEGVLHILQQEGDAEGIDQIVEPAAALDTFLEALGRGAAR